ncbi:hypothetical protein [Desulfovibrio sp. ZJ200]|uniref:hypothetical protein n=1 Tax=Desulfovibrio sp. ZJ200 TaxID=2709792 RepID=UPI0019809C91|nr:hypothetical protein [Desulfovibrio sp. ZJ200]
MLMPVSIAWAAQYPLSRASVEERLQAIFRFLHLDDADRFGVQLVSDGIAV